MHTGRRQFKSKQVALVRDQSRPGACAACFLDGSLVLSSDDGASMTAIEACANRLAAIHGVPLVDTNHHVLVHGEWDTIRDYLQECGELLGGVVLEEVVATLHEYNPLGFHPAFPPVQFQQLGNGMTYWAWIAQEWTARRKKKEQAGYFLDKNPDGRYRFVLPNGITSKQSYPSAVAAWDVVIQEA
ncbi:hypothetical protein [Thiolapillus sp.]|uniref:hypothetical protein n=1 Tax=Thiolapillus sp. TaxID=2017437 RepID=UPI003AF85426